MHVMHCTGYLQYVVDARQVSICSTVRSRRLCLLCDVHVLDTEYHTVFHQNRMIVERIVSANKQTKAHIIA